MSGQATSRARTAAGQQSQPGWARGTILFAGVVMILSGAFDVIDGLVAIFANEFFVSTRHYLLQFDATSWGVIHLLVGALVVLAGFALLSGRTWGRVLAIVMVSISALTNFAFIPYYPFWSLTIIALDVFVLYAVAKYGDTGV